MARLISEVLDTNRVDFKHLIDDWERRSGRHGHDLRLYSDMRARAVSAVKDLGLDPTDTISRELYFALQERARQDNDWLQNYLKILPNDKPEDAIKKIVKWISKNSKNQDVWVCKPTLFKGLLKKQSPRTLMKTLGLRSVESMLKLNSIAEIVTLAYETETLDWTIKFKQNYKKFKVNDFDIKKISVELVDNERTVKLLKNGFNTSKIVIPNYELGSLSVICPSSRFPLDVLAIVMALVESISDMRRHSAFFRTLSVRKDFGQQFYEVASRGIISASRTISEIGWNSIHRHLVGNEDFMTRIEQPYMIYEEFSVQPALNLLSAHDSRFEFWRDLEYVFFHNEKEPAVSMNLVDVLSNATNRTTHNNSSNIYAKSRLWEELWTRYLSEDHVAEEIVDKLLQN